MTDKIIIGLTGGIGSGKTAVTDILLKLGAYIIDADVVSRQILNESQEIIMRNFPACIQNGQIDRARLKKLVFSDESSRQKLNAIMHPLIFERIEQSLKNGINIVAVPLLFETGFDKLCHQTVCVVANKNTRIKRVCKRDNMQEEFVKSIMNTQIESSEKSDYIISNDSDLDSLEKKVRQWFDKINQQYFG